MLDVGDICVGFAAFLSIPLIFIAFIKLGKRLSDAIPAWQRVQVADSLKNMVGDGIKFMSSNAVPLIGAGKGVQLLDESPTTTVYLGCLSIFGFLTFYNARIVGEGFSFGVYVFLATSTQLSIMAICSFHTSYGELTLVLFSFFYAFVMVGWRVLYYWLWNIHTEQIVEPRKKHETKLEALAKDGLAVTVAFGIGVLGGELGKDIWISRYNVVGFWCLFGAQLLDRGIWYEGWVCIGSVCTISMVVSAAMSIIMPGYNPSVLVFSSLVVFLHLEWYFVELFLFFIWKRKFWKKLEFKRD